MAGPAYARIWDITPVVPTTMVFPDKKISEAKRDFLLEVERVARFMCVEMGMDPEELVRVQFEDILLPFEKFFNITPQVKKTEAFKNRVDPPISVRMWETMRLHAAIALAGFRAVNRYFLSEK